MDALFDPDVLARIKHWADLDHETMPKAIVEADVPWAINGITLDWLDACIGSGAGQPRVTSVEVTPFSSGTSVRGTIKAQREDGQVLNLFAKTYPSFGHRMANVLTQTAQAEGHFYLEIRPLLEIVSPKGYYWSVDEEKFRAIVIIEDMSVSKAKEFCSYKSSIDRAEAESAMILLANLHGKFLGDKTVPSRFPWLVGYADWSTGVVQMRPQHNQAMVEARDVIPSALHEAGDAIFELFLLQRTNASPLGDTIIHSDVHLGNWYKTKDGPLGLCDWQCLAIGDHCRDLAYSISTLLDVEDRRRWEEDLIRLYADTLSANTGREIAVEKIFQSYKRWLPAALLMWTPTLVPIEGFPDMQPREMSLKMIKRIATAIDDHDCLSLS